MVAKVYINSVQVGSIPLEQYEKIKKNVYRRKRNYILQVIEFFSYFLKLICRTIASIPIVWTVFLIFILIVDPNSLVDFLSFLKDSSPQLIAKFIKQTVSTSFMVTFLIVFIISLRNLGVTNTFDRAIENSILKALEIPERGNVFIQVEK